MMTVFAITLLIFVVAFLCLSLGAMFGRPRLKGHCGGEPNGHCDHRGDERCDTCTCPTPSDAEEPGVELTASDDPKARE